MSAAIRQAVLGAKTEEIDNSVTPEVASLRAMRLLVGDAKHILLAGNYDFKPEQVFAQLAETPAGERILDEIDELIEDYGYLSEVGTDISVPTWRENPQIVRQLFIQLLQAPELPNLDDSRPEQANLVQKRVDLKGRVTEVYSRLLAELRWTFLALEQNQSQIGIEHIQRAFKQLFASVYVQAIQVLPVYMKLVLASLCMELKNNNREVTVFERVKGRLNSYCDGLVGISGLSLKQVQVLVNRLASLHLVSVEGENVRLVVTPDDVIDGIKADTDIEKVVSFLQGN